MGACARRLHHLEQLRFTHVAIAPFRSRLIIFKQIIANLFLAVGRKNQYWDKSIRLGQKSDKGKHQYWPTRAKNLFKHPIISDSRRINQNLKQGKSIRLCWKRHAPVVNFFGRWELAEPMWPAVDVRCALRRLSGRCARTWTEHFGRKWKPRGFNMAAAESEHVGTSSSTYRHLPVICSCNWQKNMIFFLALAFRTWTNDPVPFCSIFPVKNPDISSSGQRVVWNRVCNWILPLRADCNKLNFTLFPCLRACLEDYSLVPTCLSCSVPSLIFAWSFLLRQKWTYPVVNMLFYSRYYIPQKHLCKSIRFSFDVGLWIVGWQVKTTAGSQSMMNDFWMTTIYLKMDLSNLWLIDTIWPDVLILSSNKKKRTVLSIMWSSDVVWKVVVFAGR